jgi:uracil-DNA glycosylase
VRHARGGIPGTVPAGQRFPAVASEIAHRLNSAMPASHDIRSLKALAKAERECTRCPLYRHATHAVAGDGATSATILVVGEQPGDKEDLSAKPFVGPAGILLDQALKDAGIDRSTIFVTNAVKHFKHELRGKKRLHKRPNAYEIDRCRKWLAIERTLVRPCVVIALGATAVRGLIGRPAAIGKLRRTAMRLEDGTRLVVTIHPSYVLRLRGRPNGRTEYQRLVADLEFAATIAEAEGRASVIAPFAR